MSSFLAAKLHKYLDGILRNNNPNLQINYDQFLDAICAAPDPASCIKKLIESQHGITHLKAAMNRDSSLDFLKGRATRLLQYLSKPILSSTDNETFSQRVLAPIVQPSTFWIAFLQAFLSGKLDESAQSSFAWLFLQLFLLPGDQSTQYREIVEETDILDILRKSSKTDDRNIADRISKIVSPQEHSSAMKVLEKGAGGRHDNDFIDFRQISILPTSQELTCKDKPFLYPASILEDPSTEDARTELHLESQYRLLREDMLYEMRDELKISSENKRHRGVSIEGFILGEDIYFLESDREDRYCKWGIILRCKADLWQLKRLDKPEERRKFWEENKTLLKHRSMTCIISDGEVVGFATLWRDESLLSKKPPELVLQLQGLGSTIKALKKIPSSKSLKVLVVDTAIFAYEPILKTLQEKRDFPLTEELLHWNETNPHLSLNHMPTYVVRQLRDKPDQDLQNLLDTSDSIVLDQAQANALLSGLTQRVSLIQGPPGMVFLQF